jgi:uncharacterized protein YecT (DUF1311 family)
MEIRMRSYLLIVLLLILSGCAIVNSNPVRGVPNATNQVPDLSGLCSEAKTELDLSECMREAGGDAEERLKALEKSVEQTLLPDEKVLFQKTSIAWLNLTNSICEFDTRDMGGSFGGTIISDCRTRLFYLRMKALSDYEKCTLTDSCGRPILLYIMMAPGN